MDLKKTLMITATIALILTVIFTVGSTSMTETPASSVNQISTSSLEGDTVTSIIPDVSFDNTYETKNQRLNATVNNNCLNLYGITKNQYDKGYAGWKVSHDRYTDYAKEWIARIGTSYDKEAVASAEIRASVPSYQMYLIQQKYYAESSRDKFLADKNYLEDYIDSLQYRTQAYDTASAVTYLKAGTIQYQEKTGSRKNVYEYHE